MKRLLKQLTVLPILACLLLAGCASEEEKKSQEAATLKKNWSEKYNSYISLYNVISDQWTWGYIEKIGGSAEYAVNKERFLYNGLPNDQFKKALSTMGQANELASKQPHMEADETVKAMAPIVTRLMKAFIEADDYYITKKYKGDAFAKGEALHKQIMADIAALEPLMKNFDGIVSAMEDVRKMEALKEMEAEGAVVQAAMTRMVHASQAVCDELDRQGMTHENIVRLDMQKFRPPYDALLATLSDLEKVGQDRQQLKKEGLDIRYIVYLRIAQQVKTGAQEIVERVEQGKPLGPYDMPNASGTPERFLKLTSDLIQEYNKKW